MTISSKGIELIKRFEGLRLKAYKCPAGVWTIGYGHTKGVKEGMVIDEAKAEELLKDDIKHGCGYFLSKPLYDILNQNQYDALCSFIFNLGTTNFQRSTLRRKILANPNDATIRDEFMKWVYAGGKRLEGIVRRRTAEADLYFSNDGITTE